VGEVLALDGRARPADAPALLLPGDADVRALGVPAEPVVGIGFERFRDGRGYSTARMLREGGFAGDLRAVGDVTLDQLVFLKRSGFSSVAPAAPIDPAAAAEALARFPFVYQRAADDGAPAWALRGGA
jgi:uncharacterized protein (DUF934 family)